jgi:hypothetical protein
MLMRCLFSAALLFGVVIALGSASTVHAADFPPVNKLSKNAALPDPLVMFDGSKVTSQGQWHGQRRLELKKLFQHYMYGFLPAPAKIKATISGEKTLFANRAIKKVVVINYGPKGTPPINVLIVLPNTKRPVSVFVALNFSGNHAAIADTSVPITKSWMRKAKNNIATEAGRGSEVEKWNVKTIINRGYGIAMFYYGDVDPDKNDFSDGVHPHFLKPGQKELGKHDWGAIAAWAYGVHRVVDYVVTDKDIDPKRIACVGHSRLGKTTLLAAALDERIALAIPHQAGCGGTAPSRGTVGESVERINTSFPHWFNDTYPEFNKQTDRLPFDQNGLVALCAPRPVLFSNAIKDQWANPDGQFEVLKAAEPVYKFLGVQGLASHDIPPLGQLMNSRLGYYIRSGSHSMTLDDWNVFLDFADKHLTGK